MTMPFSTACSRGDVFLVALLFSDDSGVKRRPVVIVSVDAVHAERADSLIVPLTTNLTVQRFGDYLLKDYSQAGLPRASMAKGIVQTVERSAFARPLGKLATRDLTAIESSLRQVLGL